MSCEQACYLAEPEIALRHVAGEWTRPASYLIALASDQSRPRAALERGEDPYTQPSRLAFCSGSIMKRVISLTSKTYLIMNDYERQWDCSASKYVWRWFHGLLPRMHVVAELETTATRRYGTAENHGLAHGMIEDTP